MSAPIGGWFDSGTAVVTVPVRDVLQWTREGSGSRLFLPPIQRSVVWRNSQIIRYWDSLLRGYPAGLMMVHRPRPEAMHARTTAGHTMQIRPEDFQLFDGQQRLTAVLLGLGQGQLSDRLKLWVDLGCESSAGSELRFILRINSVGQPFGYQVKSPNEKQPLSKRRASADTWMKRIAAGRFDTKRAFATVAAGELTDAKIAIPLHEIATLVLDSAASDAEIAGKFSIDPPTRLLDFIKALRHALQTPILFQLIDASVVRHEQEYIRFFGRLGQGGTPLSNDELTYSIIKHQHPEVHDRMQEIMKGAAGRVASEVHLVLAALRVAKVSAPWDQSGSWEIFGRPQPDFVSKLRALPGVLASFQRLIPPHPGGELKDLLESIRSRLVYDRTDNPTGLPIILLARLPRQLVDVLLLMESHRPLEKEPAHLLPAFVLYWLLCIADDEKAANVMFKRFCLKTEAWRPDADRALIRVFEEQGIARRLPTVKQFCAVREEIGRGSHLINDWGARFEAFDKDKDCQTGDALRVLSTNGELIRRALIWLQRDSLSLQFPEYDPTSTRDEDLPIDLDHLIPHSKFGEDWRTQQKRLSFVNREEMENFRNRRGIVGNSLGNYRWLDVTSNRSRQADEIDEGDGEKHLIQDIGCWNELLKKLQWSEADVAAFQRMIDFRSLAVFELLLVEGRLDLFASERESEAVRPIVVV